MTSYNYSAFKIIFKKILTELLLGYQEYLKSLLDPLKFYTT